MNHAMATQSMSLLPTPATTTTTRASQCSDRQPCNSFREPKKDRCCGCKLSGRSCAESASTYCELHSIQCCVYSLSVYAPLAHQATPPRSLPVVTLMSLCCKYLDPRPSPRAGALEYDVRMTHRAEGYQRRDCLGVFGKVLIEDDVKGDWKHYQLSHLTEGP